VRFIGVVQNGDTAMCFDIQGPHYIWCSKVGQNTTGSVLIRITYFLSCTKKVFSLIIFLTRNDRPILTRKCFGNVYFKGLVQVFGLQVRMDKSN
jgi:hypothetical protein